MSHKQQVKEKIIADTETQFLTFSQVVEQEKDRIRVRIQKSINDLRAIRMRVDGVIKDNEKTLNNI